MEEGGLRVRGKVVPAGSDMPMVSVVTVVRNGESDLQKTMDSVFSQDYENLEYIVIDGASNDGTLDIIKRNENRIHYWRSEQDSGIYQAMNKGIGLCSGSIIGLINSSDEYEAGIVTEIVRAHRRSPGAILYGPAIFCEENGKCYIWGCPIERLLDKLMIPHASVFVPAAIYLKRKFDESYVISGDFDFLLKCYLQKEEFVLLPRIISTVKRGGVSDKLKDLNEKELRRISLRNGVDLFGDAKNRKSGRRRDSIPKKMLKFAWHEVLKLRDFTKHMA